jgi:uncharacterized Zn-binding protein involved in type VI secretion
MGQPAAKEGDRVVATDTHIVMIPSPSGQVPTPLPNPFAGEINGNLSEDVFIEGKAAAFDGSTASNSPAHIPTGGNFQQEPSNEATVKVSSGTVYVNGNLLAQNGDTAETCNDPADAPIGSVIATGTVMVGG